MKKDINIQLIRIISMFFILFCHFSNEMQNNIGTALGQFFNVGVFIFLFISGYLFGKKEINNIKEWYTKRFCRIFIPVWIWTLIVNIIYAIKGQEISIVGIMAYLFNLQGFFGMTNGLEHLWFLSLIMICYLITPILYKLRNKTNKSLKYLIILAGIIVISVLISYLNVRIGMYIFECTLYIFAYYYSFNEEKYNLNKIKNIIFIGIMVVSMIIRVVTKKYLDNTVIYSNFIVLLTQSLIAISIFFIIKNIKINIKNKKVIQCINHLDEVSFYIYIVHYIFCVGPIDIIYPMSKIYIFQVIITLIISYLLGVLLMRLTNSINNKLLERRDY